MFSKILRQLRLEQHLTQNDMAKALNISRVAYTNYELGNREPDFDTMMRIARILGTSVDYLLGNAPAPASGLKRYSELPKPMRNIMISIADLSPESLADLQKYVELLSMRDKMKNDCRSDPTNSAKKTHRKSNSDNTHL